MQQSSDEAKPPGWSIKTKGQQANAMAMQGIKNVWMVVTPIQHLSIMNYICARKCEKLAHADNDDTKMIWPGMTCNPNPCPPLCHHIMLYQFSSMLAYVQRKDILIYPFSDPDYRYDGGSIYARKTAAKAARQAMAIELPVVLAAPLKAWMGELVGLETALHDVLADCRYWE